MFSKTLNPRPQVKGEVIQRAQGFNLYPYSLVGYGFGSDELVLPVRMRYYLEVLGFAGRFRRWKL